MSPIHDVIVVGGSYAGISAALQLARARRRVLLVDAGSRRNRFAQRSHGFLGRDGHEGAVIARDARAELLRYPTVQWIEDAATAARATRDGFAIDLAPGAHQEAKRIVLAMGVVDELPEIPGVAERWGKTVHHCPYCDGYELDGGRIGALATMPASAHAAMMLPDWGETTYFTRGLFLPDAQQRAALTKRGVTIEDAHVVAVEGGDRDAQVRLQDGRVLAFRGLFVAPKTRPSSPLASQLGCAFEEGPMGPFVKTDALKETTVPGVFACGDVAIAAGSVALAVGDGARAGISAHQSMIFR